MMDDLFMFEIVTILYQFTHKKYQIILIHIFLMQRMFHLVLLAKLPAITFFYPVLEI